MVRISGLLRAGLLAAGMASVGLLAGCAGPSTRVLPRETVEQLEFSGAAPALEEANSFYLQEQLDYLARGPRESGSIAERDTVNDINSLLKSYGYEVSVQPFSVESGSGERKGGTNVVGMRRAESRDADIVIIGTYHDTAEESPGANDNASGVAAFLETARLLADLPTDTELRFVSTAGHETEYEGTRHYVDSLNSGDRKRIIGEIELGPMGSRSDRGIILGTEDGSQTLLGSMLQVSSREVLGEQWQLEERPQGDHAVFYRGRIPSVVVRQGTDSFEAGTVFDETAAVDAERVAQVVNVVARTVAEIMNPDTPQMMAKSRYYNNLRDNAYVQRKDIPVLFGGSLEETERQAGLRGILIGENTDGEGNPVRTYRYLMKWFGVDQIIVSDFYFKNGKLDSVSLDADGAGITSDEMWERISGFYGEPVEYSEGPNGTEYRWNDPMGRMSLTIVPEHDGYETELKEYDPGVRELAQCSLEESADQLDMRIQHLMTMVRHIIPREDYSLVPYVSVYTDGIGAGTCYLERKSTDEGETEDEAESGAEIGARGDRDGEEGIPSWIWHVDLEDAINSRGAWKDRTATARELVKMYGEMIGEREPGRYAEAFCGRFGADVQPGVSPGEAMKDLPDFAESFMWFVLADHSQSSLSGSWGARISFFYNYEELVSYRTWVRNNLQLKSAQSAEP